MFDVNSQGHKYYKNLVRCLRSAGQGASKGVDSEHSASTGMQKRKRKSRWDPNPPKSAGSSSSSDSDAAVAAALAVAAEIEHSIPMSNKEEEERQKQIKEQQEVITEESCYALINVEKISIHENTVLCPKFCVWMIWRTLGSLESNIEGDVD